MKKLFLLFLLFTPIISYAGTLTFGVTDPQRPDLNHIIFIIKDSTGTNVIQRVDAVPGQKTYVIPNIPAGDYIVSANCVCDDVDMGECFKPVKVTVEDIPQPIQLTITVTGSAPAKEDWVAKCQQDSLCSLYADL